MIPPLPSVPPVNGRAASQVLQDVAKLYTLSPVATCRTLGLETRSRNVRRVFDLAPTESDDLAAMATALRSTEADVQALFLTGAAPTATHQRPRDARKGAFHTWATNLIYANAHPVCPDCLRQPDHHHPHLLWRLALLPTCFAHARQLMGPDAERALVDDTTASEAVPHAAVHAQRLLTELATAPATPSSTADYDAVRALTRLLILTSPVTHGTHAGLYNQLPAPAWFTDALPSLVTILDSPGEAAADARIKAAARASTDKQRERLAPAGAARHAIDLARGRSPLIFGSLKVDPRKRVIVNTKRMHLIPTAIYERFASTATAAAWRTATGRPATSLDGRRALAQAVAHHDETGRSPQAIARLGKGGMRLPRPLYFVLDGLVEERPIREWATALGHVIKATINLRYTWNTRHLASFANILQQHPKLDADAALLWAVEEQLCALPGRLRCERDPL
jgi:hypothetical protein